VIVSPFLPFPACKSRFFRSGPCVRFSGFLGHRNFSFGRIEVSSPSFLSGLDPVQLGQGQRTPVGLLLSFPVRFLRSLLHFPVPATGESSLLPFFLCRNLPSGSEEFKDYFIRSFPSPLLLKSSIFSPRNMDFKEDRGGSLFFPVVLLGEKSQAYRRSCPPCLSFAGAFSLGKPQNRSPTVFLRFFRCNSKRDTRRSRPPPLPRLSPSPLLRRKASLFPRPL